MCVCQVCSLSGSFSALVLKTGSLTYQLTRLSIEIHGSSCFCPQPITTVTGMCHHYWLVCQCWGFTFRWPCLEAPYHVCHCQRPPSPISIPEFFSSLIAISYYLFISYYMSGTVQILSTEMMELGPRSGVAPICRDREVVKNDHNAVRYMSLRTGHQRRAQNPLCPIKRSFM